MQLTVVFAYNQDSEKPCEVRLIHEEGKHEKVLATRGFSTPKKAGKFAGKLNDHSAMFIIDLDENDTYGAMERAFKSRGALSFLTEAGIPTRDVWVEAESVVVMLGPAFPTEEEARMWSRKVTLNFTFIPTPPHQLAEPLGELEDGCCTQDQLNPLIVEGSEVIVSDEYVHSYQPRQTKDGMWVMPYSMGIFYKPA